ncbi:helix-turn-helix domain-containing protein [Streptomyces sp. P38-E01]|uniref:Helix-turn-helix domain-containing protein n=1 Tax=Streptomyces tardus TaxID=2780544 RepID=A0A949JNJ2_9ACTN|nr:helix-turn-helix domain-containing protein [Streptomyces tardus]MBU7597385.1 helix-turn-helix domain-containing protein [Streptomyces tardus]
MPRSALPVTQIADLLGVSEAALRALIAERRDSHGDPTLAALTVVEAARRLGIGRTKMYEYVSSGAIRSVKIGSLRRIPEEAVGEFLAWRDQVTDFDTAA